MDQTAIDRTLQTLSEHAWEGEIRWPQIEAWRANFTGETGPEAAQEQLHASFALTRFMYFGRQAVREMLKSLYRDHFKAPLIQRIRRNYSHTKNLGLLQELFEDELAATRFLGVGNPSESGAHLLYLFRQINRLPKELFSTLSMEFISVAANIRGRPVVRQERRHGEVSRYVFFDDLVGSGNQAAGYLSEQLKQIREAAPNIDLRFMSLFATSAGLARLNAPSLFAGNAMALFELDATYHCLSPDSRYFKNPPKWFKLEEMTKIASHYGAALQPKRALGYANNQLLLGFSHNTPDNTLPIFWDEGRRRPWAPIFMRFDKIY